MTEWTRRGRRRCSRLSIVAYMPEILTTGQLELVSDSGVLKLYISTSSGIARQGKGVSENEQKQLFWLAWLPCFICADTCC